MSWVWPERTSSPTAMMTVAGLSPIGSSLHACIASGCPVGTISRLLHRRPPRAVSPARKDLHDHQCPAAHRRRRGAGARLRGVPDLLGAPPAAGQRPHARDRQGDPGGRRGLPQSPVHDHRGDRRGDLRLPPAHSRVADRRALPARRRAQRRRGLRRHEHLGSEQPPHRRGGARGASAGPAHGIPGRCGDRPHGGGLRADRRGHRLRPLPEHRLHRRLRLRRLPHLRVRPARWWHLHQGSGRRRRPRRQGRGRHPRGRPAQPGGHRRQRR